MPVALKAMEHFVGKGILVGLLFGENKAMISAIGLVPEGAGFYWKGKFLGHAFSTFFVARLLDIAGWLPVD